MKLYCGTYAKYNEGSLKGEWVDLDNFSNADDFLAYCSKLHNDEKFPEFMFQDYECLFDWEKNLYCECSVSNDYWEIKNELDRLNVDDELFDAWINAASKKPTADEVQKAQDNFIYHGLLEDYMEEIAEECGDIPEKYRFYIDWEKMARDEMLNGCYNIYDDYVFVA